MRRCLYTAAALALVTPARVCLYALILKRARRAAPEMFDSGRARRSVELCLEEYQRELLAGEYLRPWNQSPWLN
jgi:hypothetical protein